MAVIGMAQGQSVGRGHARRGRVLRRSRYNEHPLLPYLFILPHTLFFGTFVLFSAGLGVYISLHKFDYLRSHHYFVGGRNYQHLLFVPGNLYHDNFFTALHNTVTYALMSVPALVILSLLVANLLNARFRGRTIFRGLYLIPSVISVTVIGFIFGTLYFGSPDQGLVNLSLRALRQQQIPFLASTTWIWPVITLAKLWSGVGWTAIILLAGLQTISIALYEAAQVDGAGPVARFIHVTLPGIKPVLLFVLITTMLGAFNEYGLPTVMLGQGGGPGGGPDNVGLTVIMRIAEAGWSLNAMGMAAAMSFVFGGILAALSIIGFRYLRTDRG